MKKIVLKLKLMQMHTTEMKCDGPTNNDMYNNCIIKRELTGYIHVPL